MAKRVAHKMSEVISTDGINIFSANGKSAGQEIYHFHMHVIPLRKGEWTKFADWWLSKVTKAERSKLDDLASKLRI